jgi:hypothetical protein
LENKKKKRKKNGREDLRPKLVREPINP